MGVHLISFDVHTTEKNPTLNLSQETATSSFMAASYLISTFHDLLNYGEFIVNYYKVVVSAP